MAGNMVQHYGKRFQGRFSPSPAVVMAGNFNLTTLPDAALIACLAAAARRPNVLVECSSASVEATLQHLAPLFVRPSRHCSLPGRLDLPATKDGTLVLRDVAALTSAQQVELYDWLSAGGPHLQVVSFTTLPLADLVEDGAFLESLYYRLNVIRLDATHGVHSAR